MMENSETAQALRINNVGKVEDLSTANWTSPSLQSVSLFIDSDDDVVYLNVKTVGSGTFTRCPFTPRQWSEVAVVSIEQNSIVDEITWGAGR